MTASRREHRLHKRARPAFPSTRCRTCTWASGSATTRHMSIRCPFFRRGPPLFRRRRPLHLPHQLLRHPGLLPRLRSQRPGHLRQLSRHLRQSSRRPRLRPSRRPLQNRRQRRSCRRPSRALPNAGGDRREPLPVFGTMGERAPIPRESAREHGQPGFIRCRVRQPHRAETSCVRSPEGRSTVSVACVHELPGLDRL